MKDFVKSFLSDRHPLRILYHRVMAVLAAIFFRFPANEMTVIAVTGTNGKTTTCNLIHQIFTEAGKRTGMITTVNFKIVKEERANEFKQTTLSPFLMQRLLRDMVKARCEVAVIEVTSHAMIQSRMWGINVDTAVFTNLSHDHLDYHGTMEEYKAAKGRLFNELNVSARKSGVPKMTVINQDDAEQEYFSRFPADHQFMFGIQKGTYNARNLEARPDGTTFMIKIPNGEEVVNFKIPGRMNVYNALAAATVGVAHHIALPTIKTALEKMQAVPGRLETINEGQPYTVVVDYAHAADALEQLLTLFREVTAGKLYLVFGATGDRDKSKRPRMGEIADKYADFIVL
ncbi:MAG: UDP-N-acetylmuramoyl-L-alanyl-D-glutamate--2,6-diaminopimelate ligase, partial [Patescibacteria group bacterium]